MMLGQSKGLTLQPIVRTSRHEHELLVTLWHPMGPGVCFSRF